MFLSLIGGGALLFIFDFSIAPERALPSFDAPQVNLRNLGIFLIFILKYVFIGERGLIVTRIGHFPDWNAWGLVAEE